MKITKNQLKQIIKEELEKTLQEQNLEEINLKGALAGAAMGLAAMGGGKAQAAEPAQKPAVVQKAVVSEDVRNAAVGYLQDYENRNRLDINDKQSIMQAQAALKGYEIKLDKIAKIFYDNAIKGAQKAQTSDKELFDYWLEKGKKVKIS